MPLNTTIVKTREINGKNGERERKYDRKTNTINNDNELIKAIYHHLEIKLRLHNHTSM